MVAMCLQYQWIKAEPPEDPSSVKQRKKKSKTILSNFGRKMTVKVHLAGNSFPAARFCCIAFLPLWNSTMTYVLRHTYASPVEAVLLCLWAVQFDAPVWWVVEQCHVIVVVNFNAFSQVTSCQIRFDCFVKCGLSSFSFVCGILLTLILIMF